MINGNVRMRRLLTATPTEAIHMRIYLFKENVMKKELSRIIIIGMILIVGQIANAQSFAAPYLQYPTSTIGASFGSAYTSLANDASATYWNPAGLTGVNRFSFVGLVSSGLALDRNFTAASIAFDMKRMGVLALSYTMSGVKDIQGYDADNQKTSTFNVVNSVPGISYGIQVIPELSVGASVKYIRQDLNVQIDNGYSVDAGMKYKFDLSGPIIYTSAVVQNLFGKVGINRLPQVMRLGVGTSYGGIMKIGTLEGELDYVVEDLSNSLNQKYFNVGVGYSMNLKGFVMSFRSGFQNGENFAGGIGLGMILKSMLVRVDYAFVEEPSQIFTNSHRIGITISGI